ncbi:MAG: DUF3277 family protein [Clostridia bacterium]|nr:DUF3277 family protein [Clostridia bacterium]
MAGVKTYNSRQVIVVCGLLMVTGLADDSFIQIEPIGQGVTARVGCDGEVARAVDPNEMYRITLNLLQTSDSNKWLNTMYWTDKKTGTASFPIEITDLKGQYLFQANEAWVMRQASKSFGKDANIRQWIIETGPAGRQGERCGHYSEVLQPYRGRNMAHYRG